MNATAFDQLQQELNRGSIGSALEKTADLLRDRRQYHELFEVLKMQLRHRLGLPLRYDDAADAMTAERRRELEQGLLDACREVGRLLLREGRIREGWMYFQPLDERSEVLESLAAAEPTDENLDELVQVAFHEGLDVGRGYGWILQHYGTCNAITALESTFHQRTPQERRESAGRLVRHVHAELMANLRADIGRREGTEPAEQPIPQMLEDRPELLADQAYHLDTSHLAATVRFARLLEEPEELGLAHELCAYGAQLDEQYRFPGEEPFVDLYPTHALYFDALLGRDVEKAIAYFRERARQVDAIQHGLGAVETLVDLLGRLGRGEEAVEELRQVPPAARPGGYLQMLLELSLQQGDVDLFLQECREQDDLLGYATGLLEAARRREWAADTA